MGVIFAEGSSLQNTIFGKVEAPVRLYLEKRGEEFEQESMLQHVFALGTSKNFSDKFAGLTAMDGFQPVGENGHHPQDGMQEGYSKLIEYVTWKNSFALSREIIDDSKIMDLKKTPEAFLAGYYRTRELFGAAIYASAIKGNTTMEFRGKTFDTASADKVCLFATNHPSKVKGGNQSNKFSDAFSADALGEVETAMQNFKGDTGEILDVAPDTILIPNDAGLKKAVFAAIGADKEPVTANNGFNYQYGRWNVRIWNYLNQFLTAGTKPWVLLDSRYNDLHQSAPFIDRVALEVSYDVDRDTDASVWRGYSRFSAGFTDWRFAAVGGVNGGTQLISE